MARQTATETVRMPKQFVRPGRGNPGYRTTEGVKVETFETPEYRAMAGKAQPANSDNVTNAQRRARLEELGVKDVPTRATSAQLDELIAEAERGQS